MSRTTASCGKCYGVQRVCHIWEQPRSSHYAMVHKACASSALAELGKRGPKTTASDSVLLAAIKADLASSPFSGEGHRKVWARLRVRDGIRVGRKRVLRIMRESAFPFSWPARQRRSSRRADLHGAPGRDVEGPMGPGPLPWMMAGSGCLQRWSTETLNALADMCASTGRGMRLWSRSARGLSQFSVRLAGMPPGDSPCAWIMGRSICPIIS